MPGIQAKLETLHMGLRNVIPDSRYMCISRVSPLLKTFRISYVDNVLLGNYDNPTANFISANITRYGDITIVPIYNANDPWEFITHLLSLISPH